MPGHSLYDNGNRDYVDSLTAEEDLRTSAMSHIHFYPLWRHSPLQQLENALVALHVKLQARRHCPPGTPQNSRFSPVPKPHVQLTE